MMTNELDDFEPELPEEEEELIVLPDDEDEEDTPTAINDDIWIPKWKRSNCPKNDTGHNAIKDKTAEKFGRIEYVCEYCGKRNWTGSELEYIADQLLREDSNAELCRECAKDNPESLPYGHETGHVEWQLQRDTDGSALLDDEGEAIYIGFPEYACDKGHRWYKGEGPRRNINGKNPILFESHIYNRKRREIYAVDGVVDPAYTMDRWGKRPTQALYNRCVDSATQALTPQGWKNYDQLFSGDLIWSYNINSDTCEWQPLSNDPFINESFIGELQVLESQNISARVTEGHRWAVVHESNKNVRYEVTTQFNQTRLRMKRDLLTGQLVQQEQLSWLTPRHYIPLARPEKLPQYNGSIDQFELMGWVLADGTFGSPNRNVGSITMYQALHNKKMPALIDCLKRNSVDPNPQFIDENNVARWYIPAHIGTPIKEKLNRVKSITQLNLSQYTQGEYEAAFRGYRYGDGYQRHENSLGDIQSTSKEQSAGIQALVTRIGITSASYHNHQPQAFCPDMYPVSCKQVKLAYVRPALRPNEYYEGTVWCPTVDNGFWVAKRNNKVYVTGNSHPEGRKTNSDEQRRRGAGYYR